MHARPNRARLVAPRNRCTSQCLRFVGTQRPYRGRLVALLRIRCTSQGLQIQAIYPLRSLIPARCAAQVDSDVTGAAGPRVGTHLPATAAVLSNLRLSDKEFTYSVTRGLILDVSLTGLVFSVDAARNAAAYGEFASPAAVLEGGVQPPAAAQELYTSLDRAMKEFYEEEQAGRAAGHAHTD